MMPRVRKSSLIENWRRSWRFFSVQTLGAIALVSAAEVALPFVSDRMPAWLYPLLTAALAVLGIVVRNIRQEPPNGDKAE